MLTVVCWKWNGWRGNVYRPVHVHALQHMVAKHLQAPHRFVCVTDNPTGLECETIRLWSDPAVPNVRGKPNCYKRLKMFSNYAARLLGETVLSIDLDCVIVDDITPLVTGDDLKMVVGQASPYNGSMILHRPGTRTQLWDEFDTKFSPLEVKQHAIDTGRKHFGSDQAWISYKCPGEPTWGPDDGVYQYSNLGPDGVPAGARIVFFAGPNKPWSMLEVRTHQELWGHYNDILLKMRG